MMFNIQKYFVTENWLLLTIGVMVFALEIWMIVESVVVLMSVYGKKEAPVLPV